MILVVTVSQLKTSVPCDRIMQENEDMECVVAVNERKKKPTTTKTTLFKWTKTKQQHTMVTTTNYYINKYQTARISI